MNLTYHDLVKLMLLYFAVKYVWSIIFVMAKGGLRDILESITRERDHRVIRELARLRAENGNDPEDVERQFLVDCGMETAEKAEKPIIKNKIGFN